jgi:hypothetical protein
MGLVENWPTADSPNKHQSTHGEQLTPVASGKVAVSSSSNSNDSSDSNSDSNSRSAIHSQKRLLPAVCKQVKLVQDDDEALRR